MISVRVLLLASCTSVAAFSADAQTSIQARLETVIQMLEAQNAEISDLKARIEALEQGPSTSNVPNTSEDDVVVATDEERRPGWVVELISTQGRADQRKMGGPLGRMVIDAYPFKMTDYIETFQVANNATHRGEGWISIPRDGEYSFVLYLSQAQTGTCYHSMSIGGVPVFPEQAVNVKVNNPDLVFSKSVELGAGDYELSTEYYCTYWNTALDRTRIPVTVDLRLLMPNANTPVTIPREMIYHRVVDGG